MDMLDALPHVRGINPDCTLNHCITASQKSYNAFSLKVTMAPGTLLRVWIAALQSTPVGIGGCSNFKFDMVVEPIRTNKLTQEERLALARCESPLNAPPHDLNSDRYFGLEEQQDFN
jgi:hypothetical protein